MIINYYGENCFKIQTGDTVIITDPLDAQSGLTVPRFKYDVLIKTLSPFPPEEGEEVVNITGPGEYNFDETNVTGFLSENEVTEKIIKTIYIAEIEGMRIAFSGHLSVPPISSISEHLEEIDILFFPAGGAPFIEQKAAAKLIKQIQPKIAIPTFYKIPGLKRKADDLKVFLEESNGKEKPETRDKLTIKKKDLLNIKPPQIIVLEV